MIAGLLNLGQLIRFVSRSVMTGFVNALAILIFLAQLPELTNVTWPTYAMVAAGLAIISLLPRVTTLVPSPLVCIVVLTIVAIVLQLDIRTVADMGQLPTSLPTFFLPDVPFNLEMLQIIFPYAIMLAAVGLLESLLTASIVDDLTDTGSDKNRECTGQGIANIATGFLGGMAGCAMIGQSVINVKSGGRGRLSTFIAGGVLLILVVGLGDTVGRIPMSALVAVMIMVSIGTFSWASLRNLRGHPLSSNVVMLATIVIVVVTHNLAIGVAAGVMLSGIFFAGKISQIFSVTSTIDPDGRIRTYSVHGQVFFASADAFVAAFDYDEALEAVVIDARGAFLGHLGHRGPRPRRAQVPTQWRSG